MSPAIRKTSVERRREITAAALRIIGERGVTAFSTSTIAAEIGVTTGALFRHFGSLDEILLETARHAVAKINDTFPDPATPPHARVAELVQNRVKALRSEPGIVWLLHSDQAYLSIPEEAVKLLRGAAGRTRKFFLEAIREGVANGTIRDDIKPETLLVFITGTVHSIVRAAGARSPIKQQNEVLGALSKLIAPADRPQ
jgi:AcrR family transcriptional regulator